MRGYDAYITREPDWASYEPPPPLHCHQCGGFLSREPQRTEGWEDTEPCDGQPTRVAASYNEADREVLDIIGWDHLGQDYWIDYDPVCGQAQSHDPHDYVVAGGTIEYRTCRRCGTENQEVNA